MPPKSASVDGIKGQAKPESSARPSTIGEELKKEIEGQTNTPIKRSAALNNELKKNNQAQPAGNAPTGKAASSKSQIKASKVDHTAIITVLLTLIVMAVLIGLAYFAYNKSK